MSNNFTTEKEDKQILKILKCLISIKYGAKPNIFSSSTFKKTFKHPNLQKMLKEYEILMEIEGKEVRSGDNFTKDYDARFFGIENQRKKILSLWKNN